jgi:hypothetical protein
MGLSLEEHVAVGAKLKRARALILDCAAEVRCYERLSHNLSNMANSLTAPRAELERKLIEAVGEDGEVEGVRCRDIYFGEVADA